MEYILSLKNYEHICCVCLKNAECLLNINNKVSLNISLYDMFKHSMRIQIKNFENQPVKVCSECMPEILTAYNLYRKIKNSNLALQPFVCCGGEILRENRDGDYIQNVDDVPISDDEVMSDIQEVENVSETEQDVKDDFTTGDEKIMFLDSNSSNAVHTENKSTDKKKEAGTRIFCCYCYSFQDSHFIQHLKNFHEDELDVFEFFASNIISKKRIMLLNKIKKRGEIEYQTNKSLYEEPSPSGENRANKSSHDEKPSTSSQTDSPGGFCKYCKTEHADLSLHLIMQHKHEPQVVEFLKFRRSTMKSKQLLNVLQKEGKKCSEFKEVFCVFCNLSIANIFFTLHLRKGHFNIPEVKQYLRFPKYSPEWKGIREIWRRKEMEYKSKTLNG